jgi:high-affinity iron transporter
MGQMMVVTLREGIEMFLIVAIAAAYLRKTGRQGLLPAVHWGAGSAIVLSTILGVWLAETVVTPFWEGMLALVAAVLVLTMVIYMMSAAKRMSTDIGLRLEAAAAKPGGAAWLACFLFTVLMITREGMEFAFVAAAIARQAESAGRFSPADSSASSLAACSRSAGHATAIASSWRSSSR